MVHRTRVRIAVPTDEERPPYSDPSNLPQITDLCEYLRQPSYACAGFCIGDTGGLRVYPSVNTTMQTEDRCPTLESILPNLQKKLPLEELYRLVPTLVASVFQLSHTPWLDQRWTKKDIAFLRASNHPSLDVDLRYPCLVKDFLKSKPTLHPQTRMPYQRLQAVSGLNDPCTTGTPNDCTTFLALAILPLEISFGQSIEQIRAVDDKTAPDNETDLQTADRWYKAERHRLSAGFSLAILTCLQEFLNPDAHLGGPGYCNGIKEKVLQPLEDEMQSMVFGPMR